MEEGLERLENLSKKGKENVVSMMRPGPTVSPGFPAGELYKEQ